MSEFTDFSRRGYQVTEQLGCNSHGGRVTYRAVNLETDQDVVIKQFQFAKSTGGTWVGLKEIEKEIDVLKKLNHPGIPSYIDSIETDAGFCLVQEFINAPNLAQSRAFNADEVKGIAQKVLDILIYVQNIFPPITHRDIKPENILVDELLNVYLIDFGLSIIGTKKMGESTRYSGTPGFMTKEQYWRGITNKASDLYGLGATLICLLTNTKTGELCDLTDNNNIFKINFRNKISGINLRFVEWLERMTHPDWECRYPDAQSAKNALDSLHIIQAPEAKIRLFSSLNFKADTIDQLITREIKIINHIPNTLLQGEWSVEPNINDNPHTPDRHIWITFTPKEFTENNVCCQVTVDTKKLQENQSYKRNIILKTNSNNPIQKFEIKVKTAIFLSQVSKRFPNQPYVSLVLVFLVLSSGIFFGINDYKVADTWLINEATQNGNIAVEKLEKDLNKQLNQFKDEKNNKLLTLKAKRDRAVNDYEYAKNPEDSYSIIGFGGFIKPDRKPRGILPALWCGFKEIMVGEGCREQPIEKPKPIPPTPEQIAYTKDLGQKAKILSQQLQELRITTEQEIADKESETAQKINQQKGKVRANAEAQTREKFSDKIKIWTRIGAVTGTIFGVLSGVVFGVFLKRFRRNELDRLNSVLGILLITVSITVLVTYFVGSDLEYLWGMLFKDIVCPPLVVASLITFLSMSIYSLAKGESILWEFQNPARLIFSLGFGVSIGLGLTMNILNPLLLTSLLITGIPLIVMTSYFPIRKFQAIRNYRISEKKRINA